MMKIKLIALALAMIAATAGLPSMQAQAAPAQPVVKKMPLKPAHAKLKCDRCHDETAPVNPVTIRCDKCHDSPADVAQLTADKYKKYYNPHDSLHHGTNAECVMCHREHTESRLDCNNSNCHKEFSPKVP